MQNNLLNILKRTPVSLWLGSIWFSFWLILISYAFFIFNPSKSEFVQIFIICAILILGHFLFFFKVSHRGFHFFSFFIQFAGLGLFLISIWMLNAEGTTWGAGLAAYGLVLLIPSLNTFLGAARSLNYQKSEWFAVVTGVIGVSMTYWRFHEVDQKLKAGLEFWAPVPLNQNIGLIFSILLVLAGVLSILIKGPIKIRVKGSGL